MAALAEMRDPLLAEKALAEKYRLETLVSVRATWEISKDTAQAIQGPGSFEDVVHKECYYIVIL